jgi:hypothetical protein
MRPATIISSLAFLVVATGNAHAYLDPGTGSIILQALIATVASSLFVIKLYWYKLKGLLGMGRATGITDDETGTNP